MITIIENEKITVSKMIRIYCRGKHSNEGINLLCNECKVLQEYAHFRLDKCTFGEDKPTCKKCPIHCYKPDLRKQMQTVMRYAGPRMIIYHPVRAMGHLFQNLKKSVRRKK